jgi:hypothetical protein
VVDVAEFFITPMVFADPPSFAATFGTDPMLDLVGRRSQISFPVGIGRYILVDAAGDASHIAGFAVFLIVIPDLMAATLHGVSAASAK